MPLSADDADALDRLARRLQPAHRLLFITGAGMSADSGLPTYRGLGGLYESGDPTRYGWPITDVLSDRMLKVQPRVIWSYLVDAVRESQAATFNRGHAVIAAMERHFAGVWTLTQNVDGFHRAAGAEQVIPIHGELNRLVCTRRNCDWAAAATLRDYDRDDLPPRCPDCDAVIRPDVVLFGEALPPEELQRLRGELARGFHVVLSVGTSGQFPYIRDAIAQARAGGAFAVEINPEPTQVSDLADLTIRAGAAEALDALWNAYCERHPDAD